MREQEFFEPIPYRNPRLLRKKSPLWVHIVLFVLTFITCTIAGTQWAMKNYLDLSNWHYGLTYAVLILTFLLSHEFGHYIASKIHRVDASLPYFIPVPFPEIMLFGTFGAVIVTRSPITNRKALFDIGVAGPLAGFVVSFLFLAYGLATLPPKEFIYTIHPEYVINFGGEVPATGLHFGDTLLYSLLSKVFANPNGWLPPMNEIYHYPFLSVGWFGLFVTTLNLLPFGQLDGGHIVYSMFGRYQRVIAKVTWWTMFILGLGSIFGGLHSLLTNVDIPNAFYIWMQETILPFLDWLHKLIPWYFDVWGGWLFWAVFVRVFIKLPHPYIPEIESIGSFRLLLGWVAIIIFFLSFSLEGIYFK